MNIRRAEKRDLPRVLDLLQQVINLHHAGRPDLFTTSGKYTEDELLALFRDDTRPVYVAADDHDIAQGYIFCAYLETTAHQLVPRKTLYIDDLCIDHTLQGTGLGRMLFDHALSVARESGCYNVTLRVWALNENAEGFYRRLGMKTQHTSLEMIL